MRREGERSICRHRARPPSCPVAVPGRRGTERVAWHLLAAPTVPAPADADGAWVPPRRDHARTHSSTRLPLPVKAPGITAAVTVGDRCVSRAHGPHVDACMHGSVAWSSTPWAVQGTRTSDCSRSPTRDAKKTPGKRAARARRRRHMQPARPCPFPFRWRAPVSPGRSATPASTAGRLRLRA